MDAKLVAADLRAAASAIEYGDSLSAMMLARSVLIVLGDECNPPSPGLLERARGLYAYQ